MLAFRLVLATTVAQLITDLGKASICRILAILVPSNANLADALIHAKD